MHGNYLKSEWISAKFKQRNYYKDRSDTVIQFRSMGKQTSFQEIKNCSKSRTQISLCFTLGRGRSGYEIMNGTQLIFLLLSVCLVELERLCSWLFSSHVKFWSCMFMHEVFTGVVVACVAGAWSSGRKKERVRERETRAPVLSCACYAS